MIVEYICGIYLGFILLLTSMPKKTLPIQKGKKSIYPDFKNPDLGIGGLQGLLGIVNPNYK